MDLSPLNNTYAFITKRTLDFESGSYDSPENLSSISSLVETIIGYNVDISYFLTSYVTFFASAIDTNNILSNEALLFTSLPDFSFIYPSVSTNLI